MKNLLIVILLISTQAFGQNDFMGVNVFRDTVKFTKQVQYESNLSSTFNARSLVDKGYVDSVSALLVPKSDSNTLFVTPHSLDSAMNTAGGVRTLSSQYTDAANSGTTETDLMSYSVPANTMTSDGDVIRIEGYFRYATNTNSKTIKINVAGGTLSITLPANTSAGGGSVAISASIIRISSTAFKFLGLYTPLNGGTPWPLNTSGSSMSWATDVDIQFTGTATSDNDIIQTAMTVTYYPAN